MESEVFESEDIEDKSFDAEAVEEKFFREVRSGKSYQHFLDLSSQLDCMIIRSLLDSMDIPSYVEGSHVNTIYGGTSTLLTNVFKMKLFILHEDYDDALVVVKDYLRSKVDGLSEKEGRDRYIKILEALAVPYIISNSQEILGISILPKENPDGKKERSSFSDFFHNLFGRFNGRK